jgi:hypothetical protein
MIRQYGSTGVSDDISPFLSILSVHHESFSKDVLAHFQSVTRLYTVSCHVDDDRVGHRCEVIEESLVVRVMQNFITLAGKDLLMYEIEKVTCSQVSHASKIGVFTVPRRSRGRSGVRSRSVFGPRSMKRKTAFFDFPTVPTVPNVPANEKKNTAKG